MNPIQSWLDAAHNRLDMTGQPVLTDHTEEGHVHACSNRRETYSGIHAPVVECWDDGCGGHPEKFCDDCQRDYEERQ